MKYHRYNVFTTQSGKSYPWLLIPDRNPPHRSHLHTSSLAFSSTTLLSSWSTLLSHPSLSLHVIIMSWDRVPHTTEYSIHRVQHTPEIVCSLHSHDYELTPESDCRFISKKHFRLGGMDASEWTCSVRAVRDTPVADYPAPGANTTRRVTYCPPISVSPFLPNLLVSYCKGTLCRCGQLWPHLGMGSCQILEPLRPLPSSAGDWVPYSQISGS